MVIMVANITGNCMGVTSPWYGMVYVALSHGRTLSGLHVITLDPGCIRASNPCIGEIV